MGTNSYSRMYVYSKTLLA